MAAGLRTDLVGVVLDGELPECLLDLALCCIPANTKDCQERNISARAAGKQRSTDPCQAPRQKVPEGGRSRAHSQLDTHARANQPRTSNMQEKCGFYQLLPALLRSNSYGQEELLRRVQWSRDWTCRADRVVMNPTGARADTTTVTSQLEKMASRKGWRALNPAILRISTEGALTT